jgi:hypothetical protein
MANFNGAGEHARREMTEALDRLGLEAPPAASAIRRRTVVARSYPNMLAA